MHNKSEIIEIVFQSIDEINQQEKLDISKDLQAKLFGKGGKLDSLGLVNLIVCIEEKINDTFGLTISLADEKAMSQKNSPFLNVNSIVEYILKIITEEQ
jgi:D-alanine--poly(phosphoribitol) ligase subunit 2